jgi:hypothetical protein
VCLKIGVLLLDTHLVEIMWDNFLFAMTFQCENMNFKTYGPFKKMFSNICLNIFKVNKELIFE